jgi:hypothetical protein
MTDIQSTVHAATAARGYTDGYTSTQFAARQAIKMIEEVEELTRTITLHSPDDQRRISTMRIFLHDAATHARAIFDARTLWQRHLPDDRIAIDTDAAAAEIADIIIVALNLAEALGVDAMAMVQQKAHADIERGVR